MQPDMTSGAASRIHSDVLDITGRFPEAREVIIFPPGMPWQGGMFQRPQQLARALAWHGALVFYQQPHDTWPEGFLEIEDRLFVGQAPASRFRDLPRAWVHALTWNLPQLAGYPAQQVIYDVIDNLDVFQGSPGWLRRNHERYLQKADLVTVTSRALYEEVQQTREDALLCPNGVDFEHFQGTGPSPDPQDLARLAPRGAPVIGYHGALARWFNYGLIKELASQLREMQFVLLGVDYDRTLQREGILDLPNVYWLGKIDYARLPAYVRAFDVGLIPFKVNEITRATSPIKLYEYFAAGVPVVSSPLREVQRYEDVFMASSLEEWMAMIECALAARDDTGLISRLQEMGRQNRWSVRADAILDRLEKASGDGSRVSAERGSAPAPVRTGVGWVVRRLVRTWQLSGPRGILKALYNKLKGTLQSIKPSRLIRIPRAWRETYIPEDFSQVTMYRDPQAQFTDYESALDPEAWPAVSLVATCYREEDSVEAWMDAVLAQSVRPAEIVIVDAGSEDDTLDRLRSAAAVCPIPVTLIEAPGANIARGRNLAVEQARHSLIAVSDFGCRPEPDWLEKLTTPFVHQGDMQVSAGWSKAVSSRGVPKAYPGWPDLRDVHPQDIVPSSRSLAFRKEAWKKAGGYPEWLTRTGEDTYFALELKRFCPRWAFVPSAVVNWVGPDSLGVYLRKAWRWSAGNGELGYQNGLYLQIGKRLLRSSLGLAGAVLFLVLGMLEGMPGSLAWTLGAVFLILGVLIDFGLRGVALRRVPAQLGLMAAQVGGFIHGARRKDEVDRRRLQDVRGVFFVLAGVPLEDTGGGSRSAQLTLELLRQGHAVVYINRFPCYESAESGTRIAHPNLFACRWEAFRWGKWWDEYGSALEGKRVVGLVEMPVPDFLPLINDLAERGTVVYDLIDDWDTSLGGSWYSGLIEEEIIRRCQGWMASAPSLVDRLEDLVPGPVLSLPNAVNQRLFNPDLGYRMPQDLPDADRILIYVGALWGEWFDWELLREAAVEYPESAVVAIGDYRGQCSDPPSNLHFLGLKAQKTLPAYLSAADLALIPWEVHKITRATSPLKVYEYLAMGLPVLAPDLPPLQDMPGVWLAGDREEFAALAGSLKRDDVPGQEVREFIRNNNWQSRVGELRSYVSRLNVD